MLVQLYRDNYLTTPIERLNYTLYNGYFNGTDANLNLGFFETSEVLATGSTSDLTSLETATNGTFQQNFNDTEAMNDTWTNTGYVYTVGGTGLTVTTRTQNNLRLTMTNANDPTLTLEGTRPTVNSTNFKYVHIRYKVVSGTPDFIDLYYYNTSGLGLSASRRMFRGYGAVTLGEWKNIVFDLTNDTNWSSANWNRFRLDPLQNGNAVIDFDYLAITNSIEPPDYNNKSLKISGFFRAKKTGTHRFYTRSDDASYLLINDSAVVLSGGSHTAQNRFGNINMTAGTYYKIDIYYGDNATGQLFSAGYLEPDDDGTNNNSTNLNDFIKNATGLTTYYDIDPTSFSNVLQVAIPLTIQDNTLQGLFRVSLLAVYINRTQFSTGKHELVYIASDDLFNNFNGTYKNYIQIQDKPIANEVERKRFTQFSSDMSFECELDGKIEINIRRGDTEPYSYRYAMVILDVERIPTKNI